MGLSYWSTERFLREEFVLLGLEAVREVVAEDGVAGRDLLDFFLAYRLTSESFRGPPLPFW